MSRIPRTILSDLYYYVTRENVTTDKNNVVLFPFDIATVRSNNEIIRIFIWYFLRSLYWSGQKRQPDWRSEFDHKIFSSNAGLVRKRIRINIHSVISMGNMPEQRKKSFSRHCASHRSGRKRSTWWRRRDSYDWNFLVYSRQRPGRRPHGFTRFAGGPRT